ncbi:MAG: TM2 domain-containing protein [Castellaniella sp.]
MVQKIILAITIFVVVLLALTFGERVSGVLFDWLSRITGLVIHNFTDLYLWVHGYVQTHTARVILAVALTVPIYIWLVRHDGPRLNLPASRRRMAIVLALLLGWIGIHRFYLGQIGWGILYVLLFMLFTPLAIIAAFIDTLRYLFMSDEEFQAIRP